MGFAERVSHDLKTDERLLRTKKDKNQSSTLKRSDSQKNVKWHTNHIIENDVMSGNTCANGKKKQYKPYHYGVDSGSKRGGVGKTRSHRGQSIS